MGKKITLILPKVNFWMITTLLLLIALAFIIFSGVRITGKIVETTLTKEEVAKKCLDYINSNLVQPGTSASLVSVEEINGVYKILTSYQGNQIPVYATKDGSFLFLQAFNLSEKVEKEEKAQEVKKVKTCEDIKKVEKPLLQAFIVSYCPFGIQIQRALAPVAELLGNYIEIRYMGSIVDGKITAMHGEKEAKENLRQICIREEQKEKYWSYVSCFIKKGETENCLEAAGINREKLENCMNISGINYARKDFELQDQYGVTGSPTLILNGERVSEFDFGGRSAEALKKLLCCGFIKEPDICSQKLEEAQAARGFSETYAGTSVTSGGSC